LLAQKLLRMIILIGLMVISLCFSYVVYLNCYNITLCNNITLISQEIK